MTLADLIARVEGLTEPSREVDAWVGYFTDLFEDDLSWKDKIDRFGIEHAVSAATNYNNVWRTALPPYTASIDAVVALIERELPEADWTAYKDGNGAVHGVLVWGCATPALALLSAFLRALDAIAQRNGGKT